MKHILSKDQIVQIVENLKFSAGDLIFIHHPITEDLISVRVVELKRDKILVSVTEDSPYLGQPDWYIPKINIIGIKAIKENVKTITCIISNWKEFAAQHNEWAAEDKTRYKNPMVIWKELNQEVTKLHDLGNTFPDTVLIPYKTAGYEGDCIFILQDAPDARTMTPTYEYSSVIS